MYGKIQESGLTEIISFIRISDILGQGSVVVFFFFFFTSWVSLGFTMESACSLMAARLYVFFSFLSTLRAHQLLIEGLQLPMTMTAGDISFLICQIQNWWLLTVKSWDLDAGELGLLSIGFSFPSTWGNVWVGIKISLCNLSSSSIRNTAFRGTGFLPRH